MNSFVDVTFSQMPPDAALSTAVHREVARLGLQVVRANAKIERAGKRRVSVALQLTLSDGVATATTSHANPYVAIAAAFQTRVKTPAAAKR